MGSKNSQAPKTDIPSNEIDQLCALLNKIRSGDTKKNGFDSLAKALGHQPGSSEFYMGYSRLCELLSRTIDTLNDSSSVPENARRISLRAMSQVKNLCRPEVMAQKLDQLQNSSLKVENIHALEIVASFLYEQKPQSQIDDETISTIRDKLTSLQSTVEADSDMPQKLKKFMLLRISEMLSAIDFRQLFGDELFEEKFAQIIGQIVIDPNIITNIENSESGDDIKDTLGYIGGVMNRIKQGTDNAISYAETLQRFVEIASAVPS